jgi:hypothetical protein
VPHFFEQHYRANATWLRVTARYHVLGGEARSTFAFAPEVAARGSDVDTFFQPSGDVVTSGTRGGVRWRSFAISQDLVLAEWRQWTFGAVIGYERSRARFLPDDIIVTHTVPPSETRTPTTTRETTWSRVLESGVQMRRHMVSARERWHAAIEAAALPLTRGRLDVSLPDKYPGEILSFETMAFGARGRIQVERRWTRFGVAVDAFLHRAWRYHATPRFERTAGGVSALLTLNR